MKKIERILVPTDLSEHSRRGVRYGFFLAEENKADLVVLHVADVRAAWKPFPEEVHPSWLEWPGWTVDRILSEAALDLDRFLDGHRDAMNCARAVTKRVVWGPVPAKIAQIAERERVDLIVMSPRRHRPFRYLFSGSMTERVTRISRCPVLAVTPPLPSRPWRGSLVGALSDWPFHGGASTQGGF